MDGSVAFLQEGAIKTRVNDGFGTLRVPLYLDDLRIRIQTRRTPDEEDDLDAVAHQALRQRFAQQACPAAHQEFSGHRCLPSIGYIGPGIGFARRIECAGEGTMALNAASILIIFCIQKA